MAFPTWAQIEQGIADAIAAASGVAVMWGAQNANAPAAPYVRLSLSTLLTTGYDGVVDSLLPAWTALQSYDATDRVLNDTGPRAYVCTQGGMAASAGGPTGMGAGIVDGGCLWNFVAAGSEFATTLLGTREIMLQLECFTGDQSSADPALGVVEARGATARSILDTVKGKLRLPVMRGAFAAVGVVPFDPGAVQWVPDVVSVGFRGRATCDVRCSMPAQAIAEYTTWIASVTGDEIIDGAPGSPLDNPFAAP